MKADSEKKRGERAQVGHWPSVKGGAKPWRGAEQERAPTRRSTPDRPGRQSFAGGPIRPTRLPQASFGAWAAAAWLATEKRFRRIMGYQHLWILKSYLDDAECGKQVAASRKVG